MSAAEPPASLITGLRAAIDEAERLARVAAAADREIVDWCAEVIGDRDLSQYGETGLLRDDADPLAVTLAVEVLRSLARRHGMTVEPGGDRG